MADELKIQEENISSLKNELAKVKKENEKLKNVIIENEKLRIKVASLEDENVDLRSELQKDGFEMDELTRF